MARRHEDDVDIEVEVTVTMRLRVGPRDAERWPGWDRRMTPEALAREIVREALRDSRVRPRDLRDFSEVEGDWRVLQVRER